MTTQVFAPGGYRFIPGVFQYSGGAAAEPGFRIERVTFRKPIPLVQGLRARRGHHQGSRPAAHGILRLRAEIACALHRRGFPRFQRGLRRHPRQWGIYDASPRSIPVARSNVCPELDPPAEPSFHAFSFTVPTDDKTPTFVVAGSGEAREGGASYRERTVRWGETGADAMREKAVFVLAEMERRLKLLGFDWGHTTATQVYTVHDLHPFLGDEIVRRGAARAGLVWHYCRPPVVGLEYEMDCRGVAVEHSAA